MKLYMIYLQPAPGVLNALGLKLWNRLRGVGYPASFCDDDEEAQSEAGASSAMFRV